MRQDDVRDGVPRSRRAAIRRSRACSSRSKRAPTTSRRTSRPWALTSRRSPRAKKLLIDHVRVVRSEIEETGDFDLEGLFIRLGLAIDSIGAKRVVLDTLEALFGGFSNVGILRAELRRLFDWLKQRGVTAVITGERGDGTLTRHGLEEYVSDCVISARSSRRQPACRRDGCGSSSTGGRCTAPTSTRS